MNKKIITSMALCSLLGVTIALFKQNHVKTDSQYQNIKIKCHTTMPDFQYKALGTFFDNPAKSNHTVTCETQTIDAGSEQNLLICADYRGVKSIQVKKIYGPGRKYHALQMNQDSSTITNEINTVLSEIKNNNVTHSFELIHDGHKPFNLYYLGPNDSKDVVASITY